MEKEKEQQSRFLEAYDSLSDPLFRYCYFKTGDRELAKDMLQDIFVKTWDYIRKDNEIDNFRSFLYRLANNIVIDWYRKKKALSLDNMSEYGFDPIDQASRTDEYAELRQVMKILSKLEQGDQDLITLRYVNDLSPKEIALLMNEKENNVSVKLHRALNRLRDLMK